MKLIKTTILVLSGLLLVLLIGLSIFVYTFDANHYKPQISQQVEQATGRKLSIEGNVKLSLFPWIGLSLNQVSLANARGFGPDPFAQLQALDVKVALLPLLKQQLRVDKVRLQGLYLSLQQTKDGRNNWADLSQAATAETAEAVEQEQSAEAAPAMGLAALMVNGVEISDATLIWQDDTQGLTARLDKINLETGAIRINETIPLKLSVHAALNQPQLDVVLGVNGDVRFQPDTMLAEFNNLVVTLNAKSDELPAQNIQLTLESRLQARLNQHQFDIGQTRLRLAATGKGLPTGTINAELNTAAKIDLEKQTARMDSLTLKALGLEIQGELDVQGLMSEPLAQGQFKLLPVNLKAVTKQIDIELPEMQNSTALSHLALSTEFQASTRFAQLDKLHIELDRSVINGGIRVEEFNKPNLSFRLDMDRLILDDYLPPELSPGSQAGSSAPIPVPVPHEQDVPIDLPIELLRTLQADGQLVLHQMQAFSHTIRDISVGLKAGNGQIKLPLSMKLLQGSVAMSAALDVRPRTPKYQVQLTGKGLQAASVVNPMLKNLLGDDSMTLDGALQMSADIISRGHSVNTLMAASNGTLKLNMSKAELNGVDAEFFVRKAVVDYMEQKQMVTKAEWRGTYNPKQTTAFSLARASATITNGVIDNRDLLLDSSRLRVTGAGKIDLPKQLINYRTEVDLNPAHRDSMLEKMLDISVPVDVKGDFANPNISMDSKTWGKRVADLLKQEAKAKIQREADEKLDEKKEELKDKLKNKLEGLFRR
ncbi:MAG: AsmA family protein [Gammaproteobacteria bacterium]